MRELDVRTALHKTEIARLLDLDASSLVVDELGIMEGKYRIDVAVIGSVLHGYEIKSASDNLDRLAAQQESYSKIFDRMTLVADEKHVAQALKIIPDWWGLISVSVRDGEVFLNEIWPSRQNINVDSLALCQLLWRQESLSILSDLGLAHGVRTKSRKLMWRMIASVLDHKQLRETVSHTLRKRTSWRNTPLTKISSPTASGAVSFDDIPIGKAKKKRRRRKTYSGRAEQKTKRKLNTTAVV